jgi:hypothetical protein
MSSVFTPVGWLTTTPAYDSNFTNALRNATDGDLQKSLEILNEKAAQGGQHKSRITAVEREIRKRKRSA